MSLSGAFEDIFLMITLWGYDLVNPALWGDMGESCPQYYSNYYLI